MARSSIAAVLAAFACACAGGESTSRSDTSSFPSGQGVVETFEYVLPVSDEVAERGRQTIEDRAHETGVNDVTVVRDGQRLIVTIPGGDLARARASADELTHALDAPAPTQPKLISIEPLQDP